MIQRRTAWNVGLRTSSQSGLVSKVTSKVYSQLSHSDKIARGLANPRQRTLAIGPYARRTHRRNVRLGSRHGRGSRLLTYIQQGGPPVMSTGTAAGLPAGSPQESSPRLRPHALGFPPLLAQSVALISPTMTAVLIIALAFVDAGQGTWAAYLFGTVMLLFVVFGLNQFADARRPRGRCTPIPRAGSGRSAGVLSGWALIWSYLFIAIAGLAGFSIFAQAIPVGARGARHVSPFLLFCDQRRRLPDDRVEGHSPLVAADARVRGALGGLHPRPGGGRAVQARRVGRHRAAAAQGRAASKAWTSRS